MKKPGSSKSCSARQPHRHLECSALQGLRPRRGVQPWRSGDRFADGEADAGARIFALLCRRFGTARRSPWRISPRESTPSSQTERRSNPSSTWPAMAMRGVSPHGEIYRIADQIMHEPRELRRVSLRNSTQGASRLTWAPNASISSESRSAPIGSRRADRAAALWRARRRVNRRQVVSQLARAQRRAAHHLARIGHILVVRGGDGGVEHLRESRRSCAAAPADHVEAT